MKQARQRVYSFVVCVAAQRETEAKCVCARVLHHWGVGCATTLLGGNTKIILVFVPPWKSLLKINKLIIQKSHNINTAQHLSCDLSGNLKGRDKKQL